MAPSGGGPRGAGWLAEVPLAHRGLHGHGVPENTLAAFAAARDAGVGVELDVRLAADGVPVVFHDRTLTRLAGRPGPVGTHTSTALAGFGLAGTNESVPTLAAVLDLMGALPVMVEVKSDSLRPSALEPAVAAVLAGHRGLTCVASFNPLSVRWFRRHAPTVLRVLTAMPSAIDLAGRELRLANLQAVAFTDPAAVSYDIHGIGSPALQRYRGAGGVVVAWTVRTLDDLTAARHLADNVIFESLPTEVISPRERS